MNSWDLGVQKLEELLNLAQSVQTDFERASVFAATTALEKMFDADTDERLGDGQFNSYAMEKVTQICWAINGIVGYDVDNGHDAKQLAVFALGDISTLKRVLNDSAEMTS